MKYNFKYHGKVAAITVGEVALVGTSMLVTKKFLDFNTLFKNKIAADPNYANKWFIKHQGAVKVVIGVLAAAHIKNPWIKLAVLGIAMEGFISEVRVLSTTSDGVSFFDKIGAGNMQNLPVDDELNRLADQYDRNLAAGPQMTDFRSSVAGMQMTDFRSSVAGPVIDLTDNIEMSTAGPEWEASKWSNEWAA